MAMIINYKDAFGTSDTFEVTIADGIRLGDLPGLVELAEHLQAGSVTLDFDDPDADLGTGGDAIRAQARIKFNETSAPAGSQRTYTGIIGARTYSRRPGSEKIGAQRQIAVELFDLNCLLSMRVIPQSDRTAIRKAESVTARMSWLTATNYMGGVVDWGLVAANATMMTANDYRGQRPANVVNDCEMAAGFGWNAFVYYWDEAATNPGLYFDNANTSTALSSDIRISNVLADIDDFDDPSALTFAPYKDASLRRDPTDIGSGVYLPYKNGAVFVERAATVDYYGRKDISAPNSNVSTRARALAQAQDFADQHSTEDERITVTVELPPAKVNDIRAGMRMEVKFSHLPGYEDFRWCRILSRAPGQTQATKDRYQVQLDLSPQEQPCGEVTDFTPFIATITSGLAGDGASGSPILNVSACVDGNPLTATDFQAGGAGGSNPPSWWITADMGSAVTLTDFTTLSDDILGSGIESGLATAKAPIPPNQYTRFSYSDDNSTYHEFNVTKTFDDGNLPILQTWTFDGGPITARYWRITKGGKDSGNIWGSITLYEWGLLGTDCPDAAVPPVVDPTPPVGSIPSNGGTGTTLDKDFADGVLSPFVIQTYPNSHPGDDMIEYGLFAPGQVSVHDGYLDLRATKQSDGTWLQAFVATFNDDGTDSRTFDFQYGTVVVVARMNDGQGAWQGFWLLDKFASGAEVDWPELISSNFTANVHGSSNDGQDASETFASDWHEYKIVKTSTDITYYLDGSLVGTTTGANMTERVALLADAKLGPPGTAPDGTTPELYLQIATIRVDP